MMVTLDKVDLEILRTLQDDGRLTMRELASRVSLSSTPVFERLKRLEANGYIMKYMAVLDANKLHRGFTVFCNVKLRRLNTEIAMDFIEKIMHIPEVTECYNTSGNFDYMLKINASDMKTYGSVCKHGDLTILKKMLIFAPCKERAQFVNLGI